MKIENYAKIQLPNFSARVMRLALQEIGLDWRSWAAGAGLDPASLDDPSGRVTGGQEVDLQEAFARATQHVPGLWFRLGQQYRLLGYGPLGVAAMTAATFGAGLATLNAYNALTFSLLGLPVIAADTDQVAIVANDDQVPVLCREFCQERVLSATVQVLTDMHPTLRPVTRLETTLRVNPARARWSRALGIPIVFGAAVTRLILRENVSDAGLPMTDSLLGPAFNLECEKAIHEAEALDNTLARLFRVLLQAGPPYPGVAAVSSALGLSERTLHRRLSEQGLGFSDVLDSVRRQRATALLQETDLPLDDIAAIVGFSEAASFSRAYKQWTGSRPTSVRNGIRRGDNRR